MILGTLSEATQSHQVSAKGGVAVASGDHEDSDESPPVSASRVEPKRTSAKGGGFEDGVRVAVVCGRRVIVIMLSVVRLDNMMLLMTSSFTAKIVRVRILTTKLN